MADMIKFRFVVAGEAQFSRMIQNVGGAVTNMIPAWREIAWDFYQLEAERFQGGAWIWTALNPEYEAWKGAHGFSTRTLVKTGALEASLTNQSAEGAVCEMKPDGLVIGTKLRTPDGRWNIGMLAQMGTRHSIVREVIRIDDKAKARWSRYMADCARKQIKAAREASKGATV